MPILRLLVALSLVSPLAVAQRQFYELPPVSYSETEATDPMATLAKTWMAGKAGMPKGRPLEVLRSVLEQLDVPEESQVMVHSRTSLQNNLITYRNPRAIYHSPETYVGYVPGGDIEVAATDAKLGPVFYLLKMDRVGKENFVVREDSCLQCHGTSRTELVPGLMVRSVFTDRNGHPILSAGTFQSTHHSALKERWGGWFVTGQHGEFRHMGNLRSERLDEGGATFDYEKGANWDTLKGRLDTSKYLRPTSDIVSLMVLEHQCLTQNILTKAAMEYRRMVFLQRAVDPEVDITKPEGLAARSAADSAKEIVEAFLFCEEFDLGDGVEGDAAFVEAFEKNGPMTAKGDSLREMRLYGRLFKHRCSYLIHSTAFRSLPDVVKEGALVELWKALTGDAEKYAHLGPKERRRIIGIVRETVEGLPDCWKPKEEVKSAGP